MALADIINKIEADGQSEADRVLAAASERAAEIVAAAESAARANDESATVATQVETAREVSRIVVSAKLAARDGALARRHELVDEVLAATGDALAALSDADYATFLARRIIDVAHGGETILVGSDDSQRVDAIVEALRMLAPGLTVAFSEAPAGFDRGVLIEGDRVRADLSLTTLVQERRDDLELTIASVLFSEGA